MTPFRLLNTLVTDGAFTAAGWFIAFPKIDLAALERLFRHRVLRMLLPEHRIDEAVIRTLLGWRHSGFSLHNEVRIGSQDGEGRRAVAEYIFRSPFSLEKVRYHPTTGTVVYHVSSHQEQFPIISSTPSRRHPARRALYAEAPRNHSWSGRPAAPVGRPNPWVAP